jgi:hypothetical protein
MSTKISFTKGHGRTADIAERPFSFEQSADDAVALLGNSLTETNHEWRPRQERKIEAYE